MKNYYIDLIEKTASDVMRIKEDNETHFMNDRLVPALKRTALPHLVANTVANGLAGKGAYGAANNARAVGTGVGAVLKAKAVSDKFRENGLKPSVGDYAMATLVPFSSPESRLKKAKRRKENLGIGGY